MISFKQYLTELFDKPYPFGKSSSEEHYMFQVDGKTYGMRFNKIDPMGNYEVDFFVDSPGKAGYELRTSKNNATRIYSTLVAITKDFIKNNKFTSLTFIPSDKRTIPLYTKYGKWLAKETKSVFRTVDDPWRDVPVFEINKR